MPAAKPPSRNPGSQPALRRRNTKRVLETLASRGPTTQANLARVTGLSTGTISNIVKELQAEKRINSRPIIHSGRRAIEISLRGDERVAIGVDVDRTGLHIIITRLDHTIISEISRPLDLGHTAKHTLQLTRRLIDDELARHDISFSDVVGAGLGLPTALDNNNSPIGNDPLFTNWDGVDLAELLHTTMPFTVHVDNDANLGALAQISWGPFGTARSLVFIKVAEGIGAGLILDGQVVRGALGTAGEIGHLLVNAQGEFCHCGNRGCLVTVASTTHIVSAVRKAKHLNTLTETEVVDLARQRDLPTLRIIDDAAQALGIGVAAISNLLNPATVVIGGPLIGIGAPLLDPIGRSLHRHTLPSIASSTSLVMGQLGARAEALGAAALAAQNSAIITI